MLHRLDPHVAKRPNSSISIPDLLNEETPAHLADTHRPNRLCQKRLKSHHRETEDEQRTTNPPESRHTQSEVSDSYPPNYGANKQSNSLRHSISPRLTSKIIRDAETEDVISLKHRVTQESTIPTAQTVPEMSRAMPVYNLDSSMMHTPTRPGAQYPNQTSSVSHGEHNYAHYAEHQSRSLDGFPTTRSTTDPAMYGVPQEMGHPAMTIEQVPALYNVGFPESPSATEMLAYADSCLPERKVSQGKRNLTVHIPDSRSSNEIEIVSSSSAQFQQERTPMVRPTTQTIDSVKSASFAETMLIPAGGLPCEVSEMKEASQSPSYHIYCRQHPERARMCGFGEKDRRPLDPPPVLHCSIVSNFATGLSALALQDTSLAVHVSLCNDTCTEERNLIATSIARKSITSRGRDSTIKESKAASDAIKITRVLMGTLVASPMVMDDENGQQGVFFVFPDLSVRTEGRYRLSFTLVSTDCSSTLPAMKVLGHCFSSVITVFSAKKFPGMMKSTNLMKAFARQGMKLQIRNDARGKRNRDSDCETLRVSDPFDQDLLDAPYSDLQDMPVLVSPEEMHSGNDESAQFYNSYP